MDRPTLPTPIPGATTVNEGDWVQYRAEWVSGRPVRMAVIETVKAIGGTTTNHTEDGYVLFDHHILAVRKQEQSHA